jgi:hypothetical protein
MQGWPKPWFCDPALQIDPSSIEQSAILDLIDQSGCNRNDAWWCATPEFRFRVMRLPFYRNLLLLEVELSRAFEGGTLIGSWLVPSEKLLAPSVSTGDSADARFLDGTSPPIHDANKKQPVDLDSEAKALAYLYFFCAHVWAEGGGFWICASSADLPWEESTPSDISKREIPGLEPPRLQRSEDDKWFFDACVLFRRTLFQGNFEIERSGTIKLFNDNLLSAEPLPLVADKRLRGFRVV